MKFLNSTRFPYCSGCGHHSVAINTARALELINIQPLDVVSISDIGCCGLIDPYLKCHTLHGLHGRACALATGVCLGLKDERKKVVAFQGDGGSTIGLAHILEAARRNVDMTLLVQNNMLYGMTGGQCSGLSPPSIREKLMPNSPDVPPYDLVILADGAGAAYTNRILGIGNYAETISEALSVKGFSLVEILEVCPSYGLAMTSQLKGTVKGKLDHRTNNRPHYVLSENETAVSLLDNIPVSVVNDGASIPSLASANSPLKIVICGSAGEGVQTATSLLARSALDSGVYAVRKGTYPITVGSGFSIGEILLSPSPILFAGIEVPDVLIIVSRDGMEYSLKMAETMSGGTLICDVGLQPETRAEFVVKKDFRGAAGGRGAALAAISWYLMSREGMLIEQLKEQASLGKHGDKYLQAVNAGVNLHAHP